MTSEARSPFGEFVLRNFKPIFTALVFVCTIYVQHELSMQKIEHQQQELAQIRQQVEAQYIKLDNMKLDKAVFEASMRQIAEMSVDIRQIRDRLEDVLGDNQRR